MKYLPDTCSVLFLFFVPVLSLFSLFSLAQTFTSGMCDILFFLVQVLDHSESFKSFNILSDLCYYVVLNFELISYLITQRFMS